MEDWARMLIAVAVSITALWIVLVVALVLVGRRGGLAAQAVRIVPDTIVLLKRIALDRTVPLGVRVRLWLLAAYLAVPFDLVPDFVPVLGYADDAILVLAAVRSVVRRAGAEVLRRHWGGTPEGLAVLARAAGVALDDTGEPPRS